MNNEPGEPLNLANMLPREPVTCFWEITDACNLRCIHCEADSGARGPDELTTDEALKLAEELAGCGCKSVMLTGGEPLVRKDWPRLARRLVELGVEVTVITNGVLVDAAMVARMVEAGVSAASVSLDGDQEVHDTIRQWPGRDRGSVYEAAVNALELLAASPLRAAVITQVHRRNIHDLERMYEQVASMGVDAWQVQIAMPLGRLLDIRYQYLLEPAQLPALVQRLAALATDGRVPVGVADNIGYYSRDEPRLRGALAGVQSFWVGCMAGVRLVAIRANGDVKGCPSHPVQFTVGNVREAPFAEIWGDPHNFAYNTEWDEGLLEGHCAQCEYRRVCRAGCTTMAFAVTGTIHDNPFCLQRA